MSTDEEESDVHPYAGREIFYTKCLLLDRLQNEWTTFWGHQDEFNQLKELINRTAEFGESNSALIIGQRNSGKTTLIASVLHSLVQNKEFSEKMLIVHLNGMVHNSDSLTIAAIVEQLKLDDKIIGKVFNSIAENLTFILECLKSGNRQTSKSVLFILDEFDAFCAQSTQTVNKQMILYNLFDIAQSAQSPICVIGLTCKFDVLQMLEKRVQSRFSHRKICLYTGSNTFESILHMIKELLSLPHKWEFRNNLKNNKIDVNNDLNWPTYIRRNFSLAYYPILFEDTWIIEWNRKVTIWLEDKRVIELFKFFYEYEMSVAAFKKLLYHLITRITFDHQFVTTEDLQEIKTMHLDKDEQIDVLLDLSILEVCLIIAAKQHCEIHDREPFNFEIILAKLQQFEKSSAFSLITDKVKSTNRQIVFKAYEHLIDLRIFVQIDSPMTKVEKVYRMYRLNLTYRQIKVALGKYKSLPTDVAQWARTLI